MMNKLLVEINGIYYDVIATYHCDKNNKDYIIYTDKRYNENTNVYGGLYHIHNGKYIVKALTTDEDKEIFKELIKTIIKNVNKKVIDFQ